MEKYLKEIDFINSEIIEFNKHLSANYQIPTFDLDSAFDEKQIVKVIHGDWNAFPFPNNATRGVYFVFGYERKENEKNGLYIGKASFGSATSARLYAHLHPHRNADKFTMNGYNEEVYVVEYIASIDLDKLNISFIAPALEEFLITSLCNKLNLINGIGN